MVIEDDYEVANIMSAALKVAGYEVAVVRHGKTASEELASQTPHLIMLDLHLPGVSGKTLLDQIRSDERLADTHVMLVTADARQAQSMQDDATFVLLKPVSYDQLNNLALRLLPDSQ